MPPPDDVRLGTLTLTVLDGAVWRHASAFPTFQGWADEVETVLNFLEVQGVFERFLPRLRGRESERDGALAEARTGFFFRRNGFRILGWQPEAVRGRPGDMEIQWRDTEPIFVEVKGPGWEGELSEREIHAGRQFGPKYINAEARVVGPAGRVIYAVDKSLPKLAPARINFVVVVDDLFLSPTELPKAYLTDVVTRGMADANHNTVGGVFLLNPVSYTGTGAIEYRKYFIPNRVAVRQLPPSVYEGFLAGNRDPQGPHWLRDGGE